MHNQTQQEWNNNERHLADVIYQFIFVNIIKSYSKLSSFFLTIYDNPVLA